MKFVLVLFFCDVAYTMDQLHSIVNKKVTEREKMIYEVFQELSDPVAVDHMNNPLYFSSAQENDDAFEKYRLMLEQKMENERISKELKIEKEKIKIREQKERTDTCYKRLSVLCIILGHISGIW